MLFLPAGAGADAGRYGPLLTVYGFKFDDGRGVAAAVGGGGGGAYGFV